MRAVPLLLVLALAGCLAPAPTAAPGPTERAAFLTADMAFADAPEAMAKGVRAGSFFKAWAQGTDYPTWRGAAATEDLLVGNVTVDLIVRVTGPVARTFRFPDMMVYAGAGDAWMSINTTQTAPVLLPGQVYSFTFVIAPPAGGLWLPPGEALGIKVVPVMHQNDASDVEVVVGGANPSRLSWTEERAPALVPALRETRGNASGDLAGSAYAGQATPASARHRTAVEVNGTPRLLVAWMNTTANQGVPDLDLELISPDGESLVFAGTPTPREMIRLRDVNLPGPGAYTLVTHNYGSARASFTLEWAVAADEEVSAASAKGS